MLENHSTHELFEKMKTWRDEIKLQSHFLKVEVRDEWEELEDKWKELGDSLRKMDAKAGGMGEEMKSNAKKLAQHLHDRYERIKKTFTEGSQ